MFGWTRIATLAAVAAMLAMATGVAGATSKPGSVSGAGSQLTRAGKITGSAATRAALLTAANLRTRAGAARYLRSIGLRASHLVIQRGIRNYAGANCPGKGWSCTSTAHPVIQIAAAGGSNTFQCATTSCAVVQIAAAGSKPNSGTCIKTTGLSQSCSINQSSATANNMAMVLEKTAKMSGLTQTASATAQITQQATGASNTNKACVYQDISVEGSNGIAKKGVPVTVTLNAHQSISITQNSVGGSNTVGNANATTGACESSNPLTQSQTLTSNATGSGLIAQNENASDSGPNMSLDVSQNSTSGTNTSAFNQTNVLTAVASTPVGPVNQTQSSANGGLLATVNQFSHDVSTSIANQTETQCEHAQISGTLGCDTPHPPGYSLTQVQYGPIRKGTGLATQGDNSGDSFLINQSSTQDNDTGQNQQNFVQGDCSTSGSCTATQTTDINGTPTTNTQTGSNVNTEINCSSEGGCTPSGGSVSVSNTGLSASNTDVGEFGFGGMRGDGTGSIAVSGITAPVIGAFLYWNGPTNSSDPMANAAVNFDGTPVTGTNIGFASSNCWPFANSQSYRADVTSLVTGNGSYSLSNFVKLPDVDINGVSLIVFYNDGNSSNDRSVVLWNGNDSNIVSTFDPADWDETISGVQYPGSGAASLDLVVSDGQTAADGALVLNGTELVPAGNIFQGDSTPAGSFNSNGDLWDVKSFNIPSSFLQTGSNTLNLTSAASSDCLSLVVAAANMPASAPVIP